MPINQPPNQKAEIITRDVPGPRSRELRAQEDRLLAPGLQGFAQMAGIVVAEARGSTVTDVDGNTFLDIIGGIGVNGLGHSHPQFISALETQLEKASVGSFTSPARVRLLERLDAHRPSPDLHKVQLYSSGAEAVESAMRLAKAYTGKWEFVSFWGGFHGKTMGVLSLMGSDFKNAYGPLVPGSHLVPYADCYRCPFKMQYGSCGLYCAEFARQQIKMNCTRGPAAILIEPMQGTAGNVIPPEDYLPAIKQIARDLDALLIVDEMITGFGRTGKWWGHQHSGAVPDIITLGKLFGGGFPISGVLSTEDIVKARPWSDPSGSSSSYGGNPLAAAAAEASIRIIEDEGLVENSEQVGAHFLDRLRHLQEKYALIGDVRGRGLFLGVELVEDRKTRAPLPKEKCRRVFNECLKRGLLTMSYTSRFRIQPALTIDTRTVDHACDILDEVFALF
jgi:4-aminobutyrate aminotransferase-like enzyme